MKGFCVFKQRTQILGGINQHLSMHKSLLVFLVDAVVGQVDEVVAQLGWVVGVLVRRKPDQVTRSLRECI